nr:MAG TPA: hypothetical protein [Caudoviricetes sp.]DAR11948.1 MAG TPA: hypothetical protein [Bacteriophage sp.]
MRLIDAEKLKENCKITGEFENNFQCVDLVTLGCVIDNQPTAYDVDKVVSELKRKKFIEQETILSDVHQGFNAGLSMAIQIVKGGGVGGD